MSSSVVKVTITERLNITLDDAETHTRTSSSLSFTVYVMNSILMSATGDERYNKIKDLASQVLIVKQVKIASLL